jgi:protein required for attachment to host cells
MDRDQRLAEVEDFSNAGAKAESFARRLGGYLDDACTAGRFDRLHLVAPSAFLDELRRALGSEARKQVRVEVRRDVCALSAREIERTYFKAA